MAKPNEATRNGAIAVFLILLIVVLCLISAYAQAKGGA